MYRIVALVLLLSAALSAQYQLSTSAPPNNGASALMFDVVVPTSEDVRIRGLDLYLNPGTQTVSVYRVTDGSTWVGKHASPQLWTKLGAVTVTSSNNLVLTPIPLDLDLVVPSGTQCGLLLVSNTGGIRYRTGTNSQATAETDGRLTLFEGIGMNTAFGGTFGSLTPGGPSRMFRGQISYSTEAAGTSGSLVTAAAGSSSIGGISFDVQARHGDVVVNGLEVNTQAGLLNLQIWTTKAHVSQATTTLGSTDWRLLGTVTNFSAPGGVVRLPIAFEVVVPAGLSQGFYVTTTNNPMGLKGVADVAGNGSARVSNQDVSVYSGQKTLPGFGSQSGFGLVDGTVLYRRVKDHGGIVGGAFGSVGGLQPYAGASKAVYFDLKSNEPIVVNSIDYYLDNINTYDIEVWAVTGGGSYASHMSNQSAWTRISVETLNVTTNGIQPIASNLRLFIPAGGVQGIYLAASGNVIPAFPLGQDFSLSGDLVSDGTATITVGNSGDYPFIPLFSNILPDVTVNYREAGHASDGFYETFSSASGIVAPNGWISSLVKGKNEKSDGWRFDNPGGRNINNPQSAPVASCDSDYSGTLNPIDASLVSPRFDASTGKIILSFDHHFDQYSSSVGTVEVWDGSGWNVVASYSVDNTNPTLERLDITAATGGHTEAQVRFRYVGNYDWFWLIDNVHLSMGQEGQRPQLGVGEFDINFAKERHGEGVTSGLPGPYTASTTIYAPTIFSWDGEPNQPIQLLAGYLNLGNVVLSPQGQLDIGSYDPVTNTFPGLILLADGTANDLLNAAFRTSNGGTLTMPFYMPPYTVGQTFHFQSLVYSSTQNIALTNVVTLSVSN